MNTGPYISDGGWLLIGGEYGAMKFVLPNAGEFCNEPCDNKGDGVSAPGYSGTVLGRRSGDPACDER